MPKAYSYVRFSDAKQRSGDSTERQVRMARTYAASNGLDLDETLRYNDQGLSAFRGLNANGGTGKLGEFLLAVRAGLVPPDSWLLVESLDRISRDKALKAMNLLNEIIELGITVVTLIDGQVYRPGDLYKDPMKLLFSLLIFMRANEESETKSHRVRQAWERARERAKAGGPSLKMVVPMWLDRAPGTSDIGVKPGAGETVHYIFQLAAAGNGAQAIAFRLNEEGVPPFGKSAKWQKAYVHSILNNVAVLGHYQAHYLDKESGKRLPGERYEHHFPAVISQELWDTVHAMTSRSPRTGRGAAKVVNVFGGLLKCCGCRGGVGVIARGHNAATGEPYRYLQCRKNAHRLGCDQGARVRYDVVEAAFLDVVGRMIDEAPTGQDFVPQIEATGRALAAAEAKERELIEAVKSGAATTAVYRELATEGARVAEVRRELERLYEARENAAGPVVRDRLQRLRAATLVPATLNRATVNSVLRQLVGHVTVSWAVGEMIIHWQHADAPFRFTWLEHGPTLGV